MKFRSIILCSLLMPLVFVSLAAPIPAEIYARVCVATIDADSKEAVLADSSAPGPGEKLVVHLDASTECVALILPLIEKASRLANGWRAQMVEVNEWDERKIPAPPAVWNWNKGADAFELWIFFFKRNAVELEELQKLVVAMQNPSLDEKVV